MVLDHLTLTLPAGAKVGVLGRNGAGKSTLLGMIAGTVRPNTGEIRRQACISWPLGFGGSFAPDLTGAQNVRFVARIYGIDTDALVDYVQDFAELGDFMDMPVRSYSSGMKARLAFGMSMGIAFDWYLVDEITAVGDAAFKRKSLAVFKNRLKQRRPADGLAFDRNHPQLLHLRAGARGRQGSASSTTSRPPSPCTSATWPPEGSVAGRRQGGSITVIRCPNRPSPAGRVCAPIDPRANGPVADGGPHADKTSRNPRELQDKRDVEPLLWRL